MKGRHPASRQQQIERTAAEWLMRRGEPDWNDDAKRDLELWLAASSAHAAAFWRLEAGYEELDRLNAVPLPAVDEPREARFPRRWAIAAMVIGVAFTGLALSQVSQAPPPAASTMLSTKRGQISTVTLADGSTVSLDSNSSIRVSLDRTSRQIWIDRGRVFFDIAHDARRPFRIDAGEGRIAVLGTRFVVTRTMREVRTAVLQGRVRLSRSAAGDASALTLTKGELGFVDAASIGATRGNLKQIENALEWREGVIVFDATPVGTAIAALNAYNRRQLVLEHKEDAQVQIGGRFRLNNIEGFARLMHEAYGIKVVIQEAGPGSAGG